MVQKAGRLSAAARRSVNAYAKPFVANVARIAGGHAEEFDPTPPGLFAGDPPPEFVPLLKEMSPLSAARASGRCVVYGGIARSFSEPRAIGDFVWDFAHFRGA